MKRVLIFGYSGFVGPYLAREFISHGYTVFGSDINAPKDRANDVPFYQSDILNADFVDRVILENQPDIIINLAAVSSVSLSWKIPQKTFEINVIGAMNILESSRKMDNKPVVMFVGSSEEYLQSSEAIKEDQPLDLNNPYGISKISQEMYAKLYSSKYGMDIYCVRAFNHTGVGQSDTFVLPSFCKQVAAIERSGEDGNIKVGNIDVYRDFSDVRDIVRAYRMVIESGRSDLVFNVGSGRAYSLRELLGIIISFTKRRVNVVIDDSRFRVADCAMIQCDNKLLMKETGWGPSIDIKQTLFEMYHHYLGN